MAPENSLEVTQILQALCNGDSTAADRLLPIVYDELRVLAQKIFNSQRATEKTLQPTILVHDVFMKLSQKTDIQWEGRVHFFAVAAKAIRDLLIDDFRKQQAAKRGGGWNRVNLSAAGSMLEASNIDLIDLDDALSRLKEIAPRQERIVELRFFGGLSVEEVAEVLGVSARTVLYDWRMARAWLRKQLDDSQTK